jgi:protein SCO1/2
VVSLLVIVAIVVRSFAEIDAGAAPGGSNAGGVASPSDGPAPSGTPPDLDRYRVPAAPAPELELVGPDGPVSLRALRGGPVLVFFGYTHCPDVCPATIGTVGLAIDAAGVDARAILASVDPERDTVEWLAEFVRFMPAGFTAATATPDRVAATAAAWGVRYARVETDDPGGYSMSHTADVFLVDPAGMLRARFPFGTPPEAMTALLREVARAPVAAPTPSAGSIPSATATATPDRPLDVAIVSSSVWAGGASPVIVALSDGDQRVGTLDDDVELQVLAADGTPVGAAVPAVAVRPPGLSEVSYVAVVDIPSAGPWRVTVTVDGPTAGGGTGDLVALDPGATAPLGAAAPTIATQRNDQVPTLTALTTDPLPDPRLTERSTTDALASGQPWVFVVDSATFKVTPACGRALVLAKRLLDRWTEVPFVHHEPYAYDVVTTEPVLRGTLQDPVLTDVARAWGIGPAPWTAASMPWTFVVDGEGVIRAKYQGILGSADVDVLLTWLGGAR